MPHVIEKLHHDHEKVEKLFEKLLNTGDGAKKTRENLRQQLSSELQAHAEFEEQVFYPAIKKAGASAGDELKEALSEHQEMKDLLERLIALDVEDEGFLDLASELQEAVESHVQHEEEDIFPLAKDGLEEDEAQEMAKRHDSMAKEYMQQHAHR